MNFIRLTEYLDYLHKLNVPGCDLAVYRDHELIYRHQAGYRDLARTAPVRGDEVYLLYSATKVFTTCAAMQLIEQGKMNLDDPVSAYLPAYAHLTVKDGDTVRPAKTVMTVRHLMSMQSGLNYDTDTPAIEKVMKDNNQRAATRQIAEAKAEDPLEFDPGTDFQYSFSHDVLGAVIEVADGNDMQQVLDALKAPPCPGKPRYILLNTLKGKGVSFMEGQVGWHGKAPNAEQTAQALKDLEG